MRLEVDICLIEVEGTCRDHRPINAVSHDSLQQFPYAQLEFKAPVDIGEVRNLLSTSERSQGKNCLLNLDT